MAGLRRGVVARWQRLATLGLDPLRGSELHAAGGALATTGAPAGDGGSPLGRAGNALHPGAGPAARGDSLADVIDRLAYDDASAFVDPRRRTRRRLPRLRESAGRPLRAATRAARPLAVGIARRLPSPPPRLARAAAVARPYAGRAVLGVLMAAYVLRFTILAISVYEGYSSPPYDLAIFDQGVWLLSRFKDPFVTIMGRNLFGDHTSFVLLLTVPIYWVWPHVQALLVLQTLLLASATVPVYLLARRLTRSEVIAVALSAAYLLNPALQNGNMEQFHPECFEVFSIAWAIYAAVTWRPGLLVSMVLLFLLCKEDSGLLIVPLGLWVMLRRNHRLGAVMMLAGACYTALCVEVIQPVLLGGPYLYTGRIPFGGATGFVKTLFTHPAQVWDYAASMTPPARPWYLWQLFASVGFGFVWAPEIAALGVLVLAENYFSTFGYMHQILYHYSLTTAPVLVLGTVFAIGALRSARKRFAATAVVLGSAVAACVVWGLAPFSLPSYGYWNPFSAQVQAINRLVDKVPPNAVVSSWWQIVPHVDHRTLSYMWPTPFYASEYGSDPAAVNGPLPEAPRVQYVVLPTPSTLVPPDSLQWASVRSQFREVASAGGFVLFHRIAA